MISSMGRNLFLPLLFCALPLLPAAADTVADSYVVGDARLPAHAYALTDAYGAGETNLGRYHRLWAQVDVVSDMNVRVESHSATQAGRRQRTGVDRTQRSHLHVVLDDDAC